MKTIQANHLSKENFTPFGRYYKIIDGTPRTGTGNWEAWSTSEPLINDVANFGITEVAGLPYIVDSMESHKRTEEAIIPGNKAIVVALATTNMDSKGANPADIQAFIIKPGEAVVIKKGIWHDACRCADGNSCFYYFLAHSLDPAIFIPVMGEPVIVELA